MVALFIVSISSSSSCYRSRSDKDSFHHTAMSRSLCLSASGFSWWYLWTGDEGALSFCDQKTVGSREPALVACLVTSSRLIRIPDKSCFPNNFRSNRVISFNSSGFIQCFHCVTKYICSAVQEATITPPLSERFDADEDTLIESVDDITQGHKRSSF